MRFPILNLPLVTGRLVSEFLSVAECVNLCRCSKRAAKWLRSLRIPVTEFSIEYLKDSGKIEFWVKRRTSRVRITFLNDKLIEGKQANIVICIGNRSFQDRLTRVTYSVDVKTAMVARLFLNIFHINGIDLAIDLSNDIDVSKILARLENFTCDNLTLSGTSNVNRTGLIQLLDYVKVLKTLRFLSNPGSDFTYKKPFKMENLEVKSAKWFSRGNLLSSNCVTISLTHSKLHSGDLNEFIFQWKQGAYKKLKKLEIKLIELRMESVLKGLDAKEIYVDRVREYDEKMSTYCKFKYSGEVQRKNGQTAAILETPEAFYFLVRAHK